MFIYWDVAKVTGKDSPHLEIKGEKKGDQIGINAPEFLKIGGTDNKYDMVIGARFVDKEGDGGSKEDGAIFILWDIVDYAEATKTIDLHPTEIGSATTGATSGSLAIYGAQPDDQIGTHAPDFLQLGGVAGDNYDMVIRSHEVDKSSADEGAIYILWDVEDYAGKNKTINLGNLGGKDTTSLGEGATSGSLAIYGARRSDSIGTFAPDFLHIGGTDNKYDMVIRSSAVDFAGTNKGAIYILWDVADYYQDAGKIANKRIYLDEVAVDATNGATYGLLTIIGARINDQIGTHAPEFLQIGGTDNKDDMVIRSKWVNKTHDSTNDVPIDEGAIYILWDVADYKGNKTIDLSKLGTADENATDGSLAIYGAKHEDYIGDHAPEFLQIAGADNYDMVIRSPDADKLGDNVTIDNDGAIYVLWDVNDYYGTQASPNNKTIDLAAAAHASSGLLTIYGRETLANLGSDSNNILYDTAADGSKILTNIDKDQDGDSGKNDIAFRDKDYTYILFGDKIAEVDDTAKKVKSKSIDLGKVKVDGFFEYKFDGDNNTSNDMEATTTDKANATGYRFALGTGSNGGENAYTTLAEVQAAYTTATSPAAMPLSDADADLGIWDIA